MATQTGTTTLSDTQKLAAAQLEGRPQSSAKTWLTAAREAAADMFIHDGFPTPRVEGWTFTNLAPLTRHGFDGKATAATATPSPLGSHATAITFSGAAPALPQVANLTITPLEGATGDLQPTARSKAFFSNLNLALAEHGLVFTVAKNTKANLELIFSTTENIKQNTRFIFNVEDGATLHLTEQFCAQAGWHNHVIDIHLGRDATLCHTRHQACGIEAYHTGSTHVEQAAGSTYTATWLATGSALMRAELTCNLNGRGAGATLSGVSLARGKQHLDTTLQFNHNAPQTKSTTTCRHVAAERGYTVFQGQVNVGHGAAGTDAQMLNQNLLLDARARAASKPELDILTDDVACSHGATTGSVDPQALFYLEARGIPETEAKALLVEGFVADTLSAAENLLPAAKSWFGNTPTEG